MKKIFLGIKNNNNNKYKLDQINYLTQYHAIIEFFINFVYFLLINSFIAVIITHFHSLY